MGKDNGHLIVWAKQIPETINRKITMLTENLPWNLPHKRYAILGVPRSGTQLAEAFTNFSLTKKYGEVVSLQEIFTNHVALTNTINLVDGKLHFREEPQTLKITSVPELMADRLHKISHADGSQPLTCRMFLDDRMACRSFADGLTYLEDLNFDFIYVNRSFEHKIISGIFAKKSFIFNRERNHMKLHVDIEELKTFIIARYLIERQNKKLIDDRVDYINVNYDDLSTMAENLSDIDRESAFGIFKVKQLALDPYEQILNAEEVKEVFEVFYPRLVELSDNLV